MSSRVSSRECPEKSQQGVLGRLPPPVPSEPDGARNISPAKRSNANARVMAIVFRRTRRPRAIFGRKRGLGVLREARRSLLGRPALLKPFPRCCETLLTTASTEKKINIFSNRRRGSARHRGVRACKRAASSASFFFDVLVMLACRGLRFSLFLLRVLPQRSACNSLFLFCGRFARFEARVDRSLGAGMDGCPTRAKNACTRRWHASERRWEGGTDVARRLFFGTPRHCKSRAAGRRVSPRSTRCLSLFNA